MRVYTTHVSIYLEKWKQKPNKKTNKQTEAK